MKETRIMTVTTKKVKCSGRNPISEYSYFVSVSDDYMNAIFVSDGSNKLTVSQLGSIEREKTKYISCSRDVLDLRLLYGEEKESDAELLVQFTDKCMNLPIEFTEQEEGVLLYSVDEKGEILRYV